MDAVDLLILGLRLLFVALLYVFLFAVLRLALRGLRSPASAARPTGAARLRLQIVEPGESTLSAGEILEIGDGATLGRGDHADVPLGDTAISAQHARLSQEGRRWVVTDLGSTNGTRVNDRLVNRRTALSEGDVVSLGTVRLQVLPRST
ncbi:MAG TPA: FHA domain-containing protein [Chloroflexota bacterium]